MRLTLLITGVLAGILVFWGLGMLLGTLASDLPGDTDSPQLALVLTLTALLLAFAAVSLATAQSWSRTLCSVVGFICLAIGFGGLMLMLGSALIASGAFPDVLITPTNLTALAVMGLTGLTGVLLVAQRSGGVPAGGVGARVFATAVGIAMGMVAGWVWGDVVYPLIPYQCCFI